MPRVNPSPGGLGGSSVASTTPLRKAAAKLFGRYTTPATPQRLRWVSLGDSVAELKMRWMARPLGDAYGGGGAGAAISAGSSGTGWAIPGVSKLVDTGTVTNATGDFSVWFSGLTERFSTGSTRTYGIGGVNAYWDTAKVYYVKGASSPDGGTFKIQVDGVDEGSTIDTNTGSGLGIVTVSKGSVAQRAFKIVNLTGAHRIVGISFENSSQGGLIHCGINQGGIALDSSNATSAGALANLATFLTDFAPDVISLECKEDSTYYATALAALFTTLTSAAPQATVIGIGSTPVTVNDADQVTQNAQLRAACATFGFSYFDSYSPAVNAATALALGWLTGGDGIHPTDTANSILAGLLLEQYALLTHIGAQQSFDVASNNARVRTRLDLGSVRADGNALTNAALTPSTDGFDLTLLLRRAWSVLSSTGTADSSSWIFRPDNTSDQQIPDGVRLGASGPYLRAVNSSTIGAYNARGGGSTLDFYGQQMIATQGHRLASFTTAGRPTTGNIVDGLVIFDSTLGKPIVRVGSAWKDFAGNTV